MHFMPRMFNAFMKKFKSSIRVLALFDTSINDVNPLVIGVIQKCIVNSGHCLSKQIELLYLN